MVDLNVLKSGSAAFVSSGTHSASCRINMRKMNIIMLCQGILIGHAKEVEKVEGRASLPQRKTLRLNRSQFTRTIRKGGCFNSHFIQHRDEQVGHGNIGIHFHVMVVFQS